MKRKAYKGTDKSLKCRSHQYEKGGASMTEDLGATYETLDALQLQGKYPEIREIIEYAKAALENDGERVSEAPGVVDEEGGSNCL